MSAWGFAAPYHVERALGALVGALSARRLAIRLCLCRIRFVSPVPMDRFNMPIIDLAMSVASADSITCYFAPSLIGALGTGKASVGLRASAAWRERVPGALAW